MFITGFNPKNVSGCVLWLRADKGLTTVDAAVASPNDISTGSWTHSNTGTVTATQFYDNNTTNAHQLLTNVTNLQNDHTAHYRIDIPLVGGLGRYAHFYINAGAQGAFLDTQLGTIISQTPSLGGTYVNGVFECDQNTTSNLMFFRTSNDGTNDVYLGDGTRFVQLGPGTDGHNAIEVTQKNVSVVADQSGAGNNFTQVTAGSRPLLTSVSSEYGGQPTLLFDGADDFFNGTFQQGVGTYFLAAHHDGGITNNYQELIWLGNGGAGIYLFSRDSTGDFFGAYLTGAAPKSSYSDSSPSVLSAVVRAANDVDLVVNGNVETKTTGTAFYSGSTTIGNGGGGQLFTGKIAEIIAYDRALSANERKAVERYLGVKYSIAVV